MTTEDRLAAALYYMIYEAHPVYANTTGWRGGIGGQAMTQGCSIIDPPPGEEWLQFDMLSEVVRDYVERNPEFDIRAAAAELRDELKRKLEDG